MDQSQSPRRLPPLALGVVIAFCAAAVVVQLQPPRVATWLGSEDGPFELASVLLYGLGFALTAYDCLRKPSLTRAAGSLLLLWAMLREMDFQKRFTYRSVESLGYYTRSIVPWSEKLLVLLALLPFVCAGCCLLLALIRSFRPAWSGREPWTGYVLAIAFLLLLGSFLEKRLHLGAAEEVCESGASLLAFLLARELRVRRKPNAVVPG